MLTTDVTTCLMFPAMFNVSGLRNAALLKLTKLSEKATSDCSKNQQLNGSERTYIAQQI